MIARILACGSLLASVFALIITTALLLSLEHQQKINKRQASTIAYQGVVIKNIVALDALQVRSIKTSLNNQKRFITIATGLVDLYVKKGRENRRYLANLEKGNSGN